jgi:hypothetical protein
LKDILRADDEDMLMLHANKASLQHAQETLHQRISFKLHPIKKNQYSRTCPICMDDVADNDEAGGGMLRCKHIFHNKCIQKWFVKTRNCPTCRKKCNLVDFIKVSK